MYLEKRRDLPKIERIYLQKEIDELFASGKGFVAYPLRVIYLDRDQAPEPGDITRIPVAKMMVSVGKRSFKRANKRNRVKRLVREAYRLNKHTLWRALEEQHRGVRIAFIFIGKDLPSYECISKAIVKSLLRIQNDLAQTIEKAIEENSDSLKLNDNV